MSNQDVLSNFFGANKDYQNVSVTYGTVTVNYTKIIWSSLVAAAIAVVLYYLFGTDTVSRQLSKISDSKSAFSRALMFGVFTAITIFVVMFVYERFGWGKAQ